MELLFGRLSRGQYLLGLPVNERMRDESIGSHGVRYRRDSTNWAEPPIYFSGGKLRVEEVG